MRILDEISDTSLEKIILYLTDSEALELRDSLNDILKKPTNNHAHINNQNYSKEITVCIYDKNRLDSFNERSKKLIMNDE